jgi:hypothetical protein
MAMFTPTVIEIRRRLEPVSRDPFAVVSLRPATVHRLPQRDRAARRPQASTSDRGNRLAAVPPASGPWSSPAA